MNIFILRHGQAEPQRTTDEARELTAKGRLDTEKVIAANLTRLDGVNEIWASPLIRAQQTAQIVARYFPTIEVRTSDLIVPDAEPLAVMGWLQALQQKNRSVMLVSHQPLVGELVNSLCGKPAGFYAMETSSLAAIRTPLAVAGMGELLWLEHVV